MPNPQADPLVAELASRLRSRFEDLVEEVTDRIIREIEFYGQGEVVGRADLRLSLTRTVAYVLDQLSGVVCGDLAAPRMNGEDRARQGAPLADVLHAYRIGFTHIWDSLLAEAKASDGAAERALLDVSSSVWKMADEYAVVMTEAYRKTAAEQLIVADRQRSALVEALIAGPVGDDRVTAWELARVLDFPYEGSFLVLFAESPALGAPALLGLEESLRSNNVTSAWRSHPDHQTAVLSCGYAGSAALILELVSNAAVTRVGISPIYGRLDGTPRAARIARIAMESLPAGQPGARQLDDPPLGELVMGSFETTRRVVQRILHGVLALPADERDTLLSTAEVWLGAGGSAAEAGRIMYCHENTVRYRLHKLEQYLGRPLDDPTAIAELTTALHGLRTFPALRDPSSEQL